MLGIFHKKDILVFKKEIQGTSLAVQQLRIRLPMEETVGRVPSLGTKTPHAARQLCP